MKTKSRPGAHANRATYRTINGKRMVLLEEGEYRRLKQKTDEGEPLLPEPDTEGNYPAREYMLASIARSIIRHRRRAGLTHVELARRAGIRPETLNRIEQGNHSPSVPTVERIERRLKRAAADAAE